MSEPRTEPFPHETNHDPKAPNSANLAALARRANIPPGEGELTPEELRPDSKQGPDRT